MKKMIMLIAMLAVASISALGATNTPTNTPTSTVTPTLTFTPSPYNAGSSIAVNRNLVQISPLEFSDSTGSTGLVANATPVGLTGTVNAGNWAACNPCAMLSATTNNAFSVSFNVPGDVDATPLVGTRARLFLITQLSSANDVTLTANVYVSDTPNNLTYTASAAQYLTGTAAPTIYIQGAKAAYRPQMLEIPIRSLRLTPNRQVVVGITRTAGSTGILYINRFILDYPRRQ